MQLDPSPPASLADIPEPRFPLLDRLRWLLRSDTLGFLTRTARTYGDVVPFRAGSWRYVLLNHPDAIRDVLVTKDDAFVKGPALRRAKPMLGEGLLTSEGDFHRRQRRLSQPAFQPSRVAAYVTLMTDYASKLRDEWTDGQRVDLHREMMGVTLRIVAKALFGADVEDEVEQIGEAMDISVNRFTRAMSPWGPLLDKIPLPSNFRFERARQRLVATVERFVASRRANPDAASNTDLLSRLLAARDTEGDASAMTDDHLRDECLTLFTAGHETTANALTFTGYLLAANVEADRRLGDELRTVLGTSLGGRVPTNDDLDRLVYTRAVIAESMRLFPPAWAVAREAKHDVSIAGTMLPAGSIALMSQWLAHRDARWWPQPEAFQPERWLEGPGSRPRWAYFPFGGGSRQCIGESFAWMEAILVLATVAQQFRFELIDTRPPALQPTITLRPRNGLPVILRRR